MDQRIVSGSRDQASEANFISKVFLWMSLGLGVSAASSFGLLTQPEILKAIFTNNWIFFGLILAELGMVLWLSAAIGTMSSGLAMALFLGYSALNGVTLTSILLIYTGASVLSTFAITAGTFLFFSVYGLSTKQDLTGVRNLAMMGLFGIIIASLVNIFLKSPMVMWITTFIGIAVFLGLIAYDTQKLKSLHAAGAQNPELEKKIAILGALTLYLDFINLFILLLRIFGKRRD